MRVLTTPFCPSIASLFILLFFVIYCLVESSPIERDTFRDNQQILQREPRYFSDTNQFSYHYDSDLEGSKDKADNLPLSPRAGTKTTSSPTTAPTTTSTTAPTAPTTNQPSKPATTQPSKPATTQPSTSTTTQRTTSASTSSSSSSSKPSPPTPTTPLPCVVRGLAIDIDIISTATTLPNIPTFLSCQKKCFDANSKSPNSCYYFSYHFKSQQCTYIPSTSRPQLIASPWSVSSPIECSDIIEICPKVGVWYVTSYPIGTVTRDSLWDCQKTCEQRSDCGFANYDLAERHCNLQPPKTSVPPVEVLYSDKFVSLSRSCGTSQRCLIAKPKDGSYTWATPDLSATEPLTTEHVPSRTPTSTYVDPFSVATFKCSNANRQLLPANLHHFCQPDATFIDMVPICAQRGRRIVVLSDTRFIAKGFTKSYLPLLRGLFLTTEISDYSDGRTPLRDYLQGSSALVIPPPQDERGKRFLDDLYQRPSDIASLKEYVSAGGLLLVFAPDRQLVAAVFDWTFGKGVRCEMTDFGATIGTIIPPQSSEFEDAYGLLLNTGVSQTPRAPLSLLLCNAPSASRLSPLFSVAENKGAVAVLGLDPDHGAGYGRDNWAQAMIHTIVQLSGDPLTIRGTSVSASTRCKMFGGIADGSSSSSVRCCPLTCNNEECCPKSLSSCSISDVPCLADSISPSKAPQCPEQRTFYFNPIDLSSGKSKSLECPNYAPIMSLVDGTILNAAVMACTSTGKLVLTAELPGKAAEERPTGLRDVVCLSHEPIVLILGQTEPINLLNALRDLGLGTRSFQTRHGGAFNGYYYERSLLEDSHPTVSWDPNKSYSKRLLESAVSTHIVLIPSRFTGSDFDEEIITSLRKFAAAGGIVADLSGEFFRMLSSSNQTPGDSRRLTGERVGRSLASSTDPPPFQSCDPMRYASRPNGWDSQLRKLLASLDPRRSSAILDSYEAGLNKVVLEASPLTELKGFSWGLTGSNVNGKRRSKREGEESETTTSTPEDESSTSVMASTSTDGSNVDDDLGEIGTVIPLVTCPSKPSVQDEHLLLSAALTVGKGVVYTDLLLPQFLQQFYPSIDLHSLQLPAGYSHLIARFLAFSQTFTPSSPVNFFLPVSVPSPSAPPGTSTVSESACEGVSCNGGAATDPPPLKPGEKEDGNGAERMGLVVGAAAAAVLAAGGLAAGGYLVMKRRGKQKTGRAGSEEIDEDDYDEGYQYDQHGRAVGLETMEQRACDIGFPSLTAGELSRRHGGPVDHQGGGGWESRRATAMHSTSEPMSASRRVLGFPSEPSTVGGIPPDNHGALTGRYVPMHHHLAPTPDPVSTRSSTEAVLSDEISRLKNEMTMLQLQIDSYQSVGMATRRSLDSATARSATWNGNSGNIADIPQPRSIVRLPHDQTNNAPMSTNRFFPHVAASTPSTLEEGRSPTTAQTVRLSDLDLQPLRSATNGSMMLTNDNSFHPEYMQGHNGQHQNGDNGRQPSNSNNENQGTRFAPRRNNRRRSSGFVSRPQTSVRKGLK